MATEVGYTLREDKQELQKQLGCMNGIFQLFDRRYLLGQRPVQRLPPGQSDNGVNEFNNASEKKAKGKNATKAVNEKNRVSVESSRNSFSSSCSSTTFSSVDCSKRVQTDQSSFCHEPTSPTLHRRQPDLSLQPPDIRDVVRDSMTREPRAVSVKVMVKDEPASPAMKHVDSPRPFLHQKYVQCDRKDRNLAKLQENSWGVKEMKEISRFSCDGRESRYSLKSTLKAKEIPRLSLDSKRNSVKKSMNESRRGLIIRGTQGGSETNNSSSQTLNHIPKPNKRPSSSVVARLMGLEILTDSINEVEALDTKPSLNNELVSSSRWSRQGEELKHNHISVSPRVCKDLPSSERGFGNAIARIRLEPAPWKQEGGGRGSKKPPFKNKDALARARNASPSVYGEIEKMLTELEFKTSGKDLRALKQILEAMQKTRGGLESNMQLTDNGSFDQRQSQKSDKPVCPRIKGTSPTRRGEFLNVVKTAKLTADSMMITGHQKDIHPDGKQWLKDSTPRNRKSIPVIQRSPSPSNMLEYPTGEKSATPRNSGTVSPRLQRSKNGIDKRGRSSEQSKIRKQSNMHPTVSDSKTKNPNTKSTISQENNQLSCTYSSETRNSSQYGDTVSLQSGSNSSLASQNEPEVTSVYQPRKYHRNNFAAERLNEDKHVAELATLTMEQPSPVSVLDAFYTEDTPSPVKKKSNAFNDDENTHFSETEWKQGGVHNLVNNTDLDQYSEFNSVKLENTHHFIHQIKLRNSASNEATINNATSSPCENENGDHRYIIETLMVSGFLEDLTSATIIVQLHPTGTLINPELFHLLEKSRECTELTDDENHQKNAESKYSEKIRRKLVFDTVNDILVHKLAMAGSSGLWTSKRKGRFLTEEKILKELCTEIDDLQTNSDRGLHDEDDEVKHIISADAYRKSEDWDEFCCEVPGLVLDIERLIFKDLISDVVNAEVSCLQDWTGRHCRQLFSM